jgi:hypothetical protein
LVDKIGSELRSLQVHFFAESEMAPLLKRGVHIQNQYYSTAFDFVEEPVVGLVAHKKLWGHWEMTYGPVANQSAL